MLKFWSQKSYEVKYYMKFKRYLEFISKKNCTLQKLQHTNVSLVLEEVKNKPVDKFSVIVQKKYFSCFLFSLYFLFNLILPIFYITKKSRSLRVKMYKSSALLGIFILQIVFLSASSFLGNEA